MMNEYKLEYAVVNKVSEMSSGKGVFIEINGIEMSAFKDALKDYSPAQGDTVDVSYRISKDGKYKNITEIVKHPIVEESAIGKGSKPAPKEAKLASEIPKKNYAEIMKESLNEAKTLVQFLSENDFPPGMVDSEMMRFIVRALFVSKGGRV